MYKNLFYKYIICILLVIFLPSTGCIKYYDEDFKEDVFTLPNHWYRVLSNSKQVFVSSDRKLNILFNNEKWSGAYYCFPFYKSNGLYEIKYKARADKRNAKIYFFGFSNDFLSNILISEKEISVSKKYKQYSYKIKMPEYGYKIAIFFAGNDLNEKVINKKKNSALFIKKLKINHLILPFYKDNKNVNRPINQYLQLPCKWIRGLASEEQIYLNNEKTIVVQFDKKKWIGPYFELPFYKSNGKLNIQFIAKSEEQNSELMIYNYSLKKQIRKMIISPSKDFEHYSFSVNMPDKEDQIIWIRFMQNNKKQTGGKLFIKSVMINNVPVELHI